jgi:hypothetical protein
MARSFAVALLVGLVVLGFSSAGPTAFIDTPSCQPAPVQDLLPDVVAPLVGSSPAWLVDGPATWTSATEPVKTLWMLQRSSEPVSISGHRLDAPGSLKLRRGDDPPTTELVVANPAPESAIPGGARPEILRAYAFLPSHVFYPSPGCWEFRVHQGGYDVNIVRELKPVVPIGRLHGFLPERCSGA